jgi:GDP-L-fucose synthase
MSMDWSTQRVVVTGASGFLGRAVVAGLRRRGVEGDRLVEGRSKPHDLTEYAGAEGLLRSAGEATVVIHCAGFVGGLGLNRAHPSRMLRDNLLMALHLAEACVRTGVAGRGGKLVLIGSMTSYPGSAPLPYREESLFAGLPDREIAAYGVGKLAALAALRAYADEHKLRSVCPLLVNLYGPGDNIDDERRSHAAGALMKRFVDAADRGLDEVVCWGTGAPARDFLYIDDAAEGVLRAAEVLDDASAINIASGQETTIRTLTDLIARLAGYRGRVAWDASKGDGVSRRCLDITRAREVLGWSPRVGLEEGLARTIAAYRARKA